MQSKIRLSRLRKEQRNRDVLGYRAYIRAKLLENKKDEPVVEIEFANEEKNSNRNNIRTFVFQSEVNLPNQMQLAGEGRQSGGSHQLICLIKKMIGLVNYLQNQENNCDQTQLDSFAMPTLANIQQIVSHLQHLMQCSNKKPQRFDCLFILSSLFHRTSEQIYQKSQSNSTELQNLMNLWGRVQTIFYYMTRRHIHHELLSNQYLFLAKFIYNKLTLLQRLQLLQNEQIIKINSEYFMFILTIDQTDCAQTLLPSLVLKTSKIIFQQIDTISQQHFAHRDICQFMIRQIGEWSNNKDSPQCIDNCIMLIESTLLCIPAFSLTGGDSVFYPVDMFSFVSLFIVEVEAVYLQEQEPIQKQRLAFIVMELIHQMVQHQGFQDGWARFIRTVIEESEDNQDVQTFGLLLLKKMKAPGQHELKQLISFYEVEPKKTTQQIFWKLMINTESNIKDDLNTPKFKISN